MPSDKHTRAIAIVRRLHAEGSRGGFSRLGFWSSLDLVVKASEVDELRYAVDQGWIELAPSGHLVRVTAKGARAIVPGKGN
jgi:hypothetical protein